MNAPDNNLDLDEIPATLSRRERKRIETRERLFEAALALLSERDFDAVTIEMITEAADVGKGTFFNYFANKEALIAYYFEVIDQLLAQGMQAQTAEMPHAHAQLEAEGSPHQRQCRLWEHINDLLHRLAQFEARSRKFTRTLIALTLTNDAVRQASLQVKAKSLAGSVEFIQMGQELGALRRDYPPEVIARFCRNVYFSTLADWSQSDADTDFIAMLDTNFALVRDALAPHSPDALPEEICSARRNAS